jgi:hypothetical protein
MLSIKYKIICVLLFGLLVFPPNWFLLYSDLRVGFVPHIAGSDGQLLGAYLAENFLLLLAMSVQLAIFQMMSKQGGDWLYYYHYAT